MKLSRSVVIILVLCSVFFACLWYFSSGRAASSELQSRISPATAPLVTRTRKMSGETGSTDKGEKDAADRDGSSGDGSPDLTDYSPPQSVIEKSKPWGPLFGPGDVYKIFAPTLSNCTVYIEFGAGGSTCYVNQLPHIKRFYSIEGDKKISQILIGRDDLNWSISHNRFQLFTPEYGPTGAYSTPIGSAHRSEFPNYPESLLLIPEQDRFEVEVVLIDGRFRVACVMFSLLHTKADIFLIDDFKMRGRGEYRPVLEFLDESVAGSQMSLMRRKKGIDMKKVKQVYETYKYTPR